MEKECKPGYHWCPIEKKCVKTDNKKQGKGLQFGQGKGPYGIPKKKIVESLNNLYEGGWLNKIRDSKAMQFVGSVGAAGMGMGPDQIKANRAKHLAKRKAKATKNKVVDTNRFKMKKKV
jgi:hypothetical protein